VTWSEQMVFVVDDDAGLREALAALMRSVGLQVTTFASAADFLRQPRSPIPACLVLDVRLPGLSGLDLQRELTNAGERIPIIFISGHGDVPMTVRAMKAGAAEFLPKPFREQELLDAVGQALERDRSDRAERRELEEIRKRYDVLTPREREVMALVVHGMPNKQVAEELHVTEITVKVHRRNIMHKMHARSLPDLVRMAQRLE
jgi:FixJ family two-component response regulator